MGTVTRLSLRACWSTIPSTGTDSAYKPLGSSSREEGQACLACTGRSLRRPAPFHLAQERPHACADLIPDRPDLLDGEPGRVGGIPAQVPLAREDRVGASPHPIVITMSAARTCSNRQRLGKLHYHAYSRAAALSGLKRADDGCRRFWPEAVT
jgi:hypothetical protein